MMLDDVYKSMLLKMIDKQKPKRAKAPPPMTKGEKNHAADKIMAWLERRGEGTAVDIAHGTGVPRSTVDNVLDSLRNRFKVTTATKISGVALWRKRDG